MLVYNGKPGKPAPSSQVIWSVWHKVIWIFGVVVFWDSRTEVCRALLEYEYYNVSRDLRDRNSGSNFDLHDQFLIQIRPNLWLKSIDFLQKCVSILSKTQNKRKHFRIQFTSSWSVFVAEPIDSRFGVSILNFSSRFASFLIKKKQHIFIKIDTFLFQNATLFPFENLQIVVGIHTFWKSHIFS